MEKLIPGKILAQEEVNSSSSNNVYIVILFDNCIVCTCPAGGRKTFCKHMVEVVYKNLELIKHTNKQFYDDLALLLEMKNDRYHDVDAFKELSSNLIYSDKDIAQQSAINSSAFKEEKKEINDFIDTIAKDIEDINIHHQFEFFNLLCHTYNKPNLGFRFCEYPQNLDEFIKRNYLNAVESADIKDFMKMDKGRKSNYFYKLSPEITSIIRQLHKKLSVKFPKVKEFIDEDGIFFIEKRIIDPKYL